MQYLTQMISFVVNKNSKNMTTLLVPTDFSEIADNALKYAIAMAKEYQFDVKLYHVVQLSAPDFSHLANIDDFSNIVDEIKGKMQHKVNLLQEEYPGIPFSAEVESGLLLDCIHQQCSTHNPVAVVMGITGSGVGIDKLIGSNAIITMKHINYPLIVVPKDAVFKAIHRICLACDLKNVLTSTPLISIKAFTKLFSAKLDVLNVDYHNRHFTAETNTELENLEFILADIDHELHFIEDENTQHAINDFIERNQTDLLIMIPKKHSFFENLFHKSITREMAYQSHIPVLTLHQD